MQLRSSRIHTTGPSIIQSPTYRIAPSQHIHSIPVSFNYQPRHLPNPQHVHYTPHYQSNSIIPSNEYRLRSSQIYQSPITHNQSYLFGQNRTYNQNPPVNLRNTYSTGTDLHRAPVGLGLPQLPSLMLSQSNKKVIEEKNDKKDEKCDCCKLMGWLIATLLCLLFVALVLFFFLYRPHHKYEPVASSCGSKPTCGLYKDANTLPAQDYVYPQVYRGEATTQMMDRTDYPQPISLGITNPQDRFYKEDHSNYRYLHLRRQKLSD